MINKISFKTNSTYKKEAQEYRDPLMKWPLRGAAFTNEIGEVLRPMIGSTANLFWIPVFLYIGADVYDKYKNDGDVCAPSSLRMMKQACFQGLASIILPVMAIKLGQSLFSLLGLTNKDKLTYNTQDKINTIAQTFVTNGNMKLCNKDENECINKFKDIIENNFDYNKNKNFISKGFKKFKSTLKIDTAENIQKYANKTIKELIETNKMLKNPTDEFKKNKLYLNFKLAIKNGETKSVATKNALIKMLKNNTTNSRITKTLGGLIAVGISINPVDKFVEHFIIGKYLGPKIDKLPSKKK